MNANTPRAVIVTVHCKRLALRAAIIKQAQKLAAEIKAAEQKAKEMK